jgi:hypothetical protein
MPAISHIPVSWALIALGRTPASVHTWYLRACSKLHGHRSSFAVRIPVRIHVRFLVRILVRLLWLPLIPFSSTGPSGYVGQRITCTRDFWISA